MARSGRGEPHAPDHVAKRVIHEETRRSTKGHEAIWSCFNGTQRPKGIPLGARASRPHPSSCKQPPVHGTPLQSASKPPLRGSLPLCQALCGRDARAPRGTSSQDIVTPSPYPTFGGLLSILLQPLSGLRRPSCNFVDNSFSLWQSRYFPDCRTLLRISSRLVRAASRAGSRARARSRLRIASSVRPRKCRVAPMSA